MAIRWPTTLRASVYGHLRIGTVGQSRLGGGAAVSPLSILRSPAVLLCFVFFFLITVAFGALQNFSAAALQAMYGLSLAAAAWCISAYLVGGAVGIVVGIAGPSRDLLVRRAATQRLGETSYGRVCGFV